jgi:hypothetical protein
MATEIEINAETIAEAARIHAQRDYILNSKTIAYGLLLIELGELIMKSHLSFRGDRIIIKTREVNHINYLIQKIKEN